MPDSDAYYCLIINQKATRLEKRKLIALQTIEVKEVARVKIGVPYLNDLIESVFPKELILSADCGGTAKTIQVLEFVWLATKL